MCLDDDFVHLHIKDKVPKMWNVKMLCGMEMSASMSMKNAKGNYPEGVPVRLRNLIENVKKGGEMSST